jgi:hypothetical protein
MKVFKLSLLLTFFISSSYAQKLTFREEGNRSLVYILNNLKLISSYTNTSSSLFITLYQVGDESGSAGSESCEITHKYYVAVSEDGEFPEHHLYRLNSVYNPQFIKWIKSDIQPKFVFTYLSGNTKRTATVSVTLKKLSVAVK